MNVPPLESLDSSLQRHQHPPRPNGDAMPPSGDAPSLDDKLRAVISADPTILDDVCDGLDDDDEVEWVRP